MTTACRRAAILATVLLAFASSAHAVTRHVPAEYTTIQGGLDASASGDTVLVAPGTYTDYTVRNLGDPLDWTACVFMTDGVVLRSDAGPELTVIDAHLANGPQLAAIHAQFVESEDTAIEGFTVTLAPPSTRGAYLIGRLTFRACIFRDLDVGQSSGAGVAANGDLTMIGCVFDNCRAHGGGAIYHANGRIEMYDTLVRNCGNFGVLCAGNGEPPVESSYFEGCTFDACFNSGAGGGGLQVSQHFGGMTIRGCRFLGNQAGSTGGAGIYIGALGPDSVVEGCLFVANRADGPNGRGGGINHISTVGALTVRGCTFWGNYAPTSVGGDAISFKAAGSVLENNVIAGCTGQGAVYASNVNLLTSCNVFWQNAGGQGIHYTPGPTDRVVDPLFCGVETEDFTVRTDSPCIPPGSLECGQIGLYGQGCGGTSVDEPTLRSWGQTKSAYR